MTAGVPPPKPWEQAGTSSSGPTPFRPSTPGSTSGAVEASGTAKPGEVVSAPTRITAASNPVTQNTFGRSVPPRPWEPNYGSGYGGYGSGLYGMNGGTYGGGLYGNNMYSAGYGGLYGGGGMHNRFGGPMGGYGMVGPFGNGDPNNPYGQPPPTPGFWMSVLRVMQGVVNFFGRISILVDQNAQAFHMFMTALLQIFDRSGMLYGELARFVLRLLGVRTRPRKPHRPAPGVPIDYPGQMRIEGPEQKPIKGPKAWDNVWGDGKTE